MATLEAVGLCTATYTSDTIVEGDGNEMEDAEHDTGGDEVDDNDEDYNGENHSQSNDNSFPSQTKQLMFLYDCETTGGSHYSDHIIEIAATVIVPENVSITTTEFSSLCRTSKHISTFGNY